MEEYLAESKSEKKFCSNVAPSLSSGTHIFWVGQVAVEGARRQGSSRILWHQLNMSRLFMHYYPYDNIWDSSDNTQTLPRHHCTLYSLIISRIRLNQVSSTFVKNNVFQVDKISDPSNRVFNAIFLFSFSRTKKGWMRVTKSGLSQEQLQPLWCSFLVDLEKPDITSHLVRRPHFFMSFKFLLIFLVFSCPEQLNR